MTTSVNGIDFSTGPAMMDAYFKCVNENGGINGRPIQMIEENDNLKPEDAAAAARKLIETDKVVAMVGGFSIIDCPVNGDYYTSQGYNVIVAGVPGRVLQLACHRCGKHGARLQRPGRSPEHGREGSQRHGRGNDQQDSNG